MILIHFENMINKIHILMRLVKIFLSAQEDQWKDDPLGNQNVNKKHCSEGKVMKVKFSKKNELKNYISYYIIKCTKEWNLIWTCSKSVMMDYIIKGNL